MSHLKALASAPSSHPQLSAENLNYMRIPVPGAQSVAMRWAPLNMRGASLEKRFRSASLVPAEDEGWFELDMFLLDLPDGIFEYEFVVDNNEGHPVPDPYAEEITRFGGYRGVFHIKDGTRVRPLFDWSGELSPEAPLRQNNALVIYELPMRWTSTEDDIQSRQVGLGSFDHALFAHLDYWASIGINAIELLPIYDSTDTLNWGYGTRFFFAPDVDMGGPIELKAFIKRCHQLGIRIILDIVMNHAKACPLQKLAKNWYFLDSPQEEGRDADWGGKCFRLEKPAFDDEYLAREFLYSVARYWVSEYRIDGFRIDEFKGIKNYDFLQDFTDQAWISHDALFPHRPFLVVAEDSHRRSEIVRDSHRGRRVVDAMWDFNQRDELRRAITGALHTQWGEASRTERIKAMVQGHQSWDELPRRLGAGFSDLAQRIVYLTSHDVEQEGEQRLINQLLAQELSSRGWTDLSPENMRRVVDREYTDLEAKQARMNAFERMRSAQALLLTSVGIPMLLAGEEFGDTHDVDHKNWRKKMSDVVNWARRRSPGHYQLVQQFRELAQLRASHTALLRNEVEFFYFHPTFNERGGELVFAYCRTGGQVLNSPVQVVTVANLGERNYDNFHLPWAWDRVQEVATSSEGRAASFSWQSANIPLLPGQVRVFTT